jgi:hypothetical protein
VFCATLAVDEHVDVPPDQAALVNDPAAQRGIPAFELGEQFEHRGGVKPVLGDTAGQLSQRTVDTYERHDLTLRPSPTPELIGGEHIAASATTSTSSGSTRGIPATAIVSPTSVMISRE